MTQERFEEIAELIDQKRTREATPIWQRPLGGGGEYCDSSRCATITEAFEELYDYVLTLRRQIFYLTGEPAKEHVENVTCLECLVYDPVYLCLVGGNPDSADPARHNCIRFTVAKSKQVERQREDYKRQNAGKR